jgi:AcrR family transcriptional regulator
MVMMGTKFTEKEMADIRVKLKEAAQKCASSIGMRKTTVDELCARAGISKGAFYRFYDCKEALFFEVLEDWHTKIYGGALEIMTNDEGASDKERVYRALLYACLSLDEHSLIGFYANDMPPLLRKMPQEVLDAHYHSDEKHIADLIEASGIKLKVMPELAAAAVRTLILSFSDRDHIGSLYYQVMELFVKSVSEQLV